MYHSITFGEKNTWDDWHLIPSSRPVFSPPQPTLRLLTIPGKSGSLDVSEIIGEQVVYADRTGSFEFYVQHELWEGGWVEAYRTIMNYLHGQRLHAVLEDDNSFYYDGRFSVNDYRSNPNWSTIVINYTVQPYKMQIMELGSDWLWDPMYFGDPNDSKDVGDLISPYSNILLNGVGVTIELTGYGFRTIPTIECSDSDVRLYFDNATKPVVLDKGENRPSIAVITTGRHTLKFVGSGTVNIHYRGGSL